MKLTIGQKYHRETEQYVEEMEVTGLESIDDEIPRGEVVLPQTGDSKIEVRVINSIYADYFHTTVTLRRLVNDFQEGAALL